MTPFPPGWSSGSIDTVTSKPLKVDPASTGREHVRYVDIGLLEGPRSHLDAAPEVLSAAAPSRCRQVIAAGDTLYSTVRPYLRKVALVADDLDGEFASTGYAVLRPTEAIDPAFLFYFTLSKHFEDQILPMQKGVSYPAVLDREVRAQRVWFPELEQQRRIVEILEDHLSHLDAGVRELECARQRIAGMRLALLHQLIDGPKRRLGEVKRAADYGTSVKCSYDGGGVGVLRIPNLTDGSIDLDDMKFAIDPEVDLTGSMVAEGDVLIVRTNGSRSLIGRSAVVGEATDAAFASYLIRYRVNRDLLTPEWLHLALESPSVRERIERLAASSAGQHNLSLGKLDSLELPVPDLDTQQSAFAALREIDDHLQRTRSAIHVATARGSTLRRALLTAAFEGKLTGRQADTDLIEERAGVNPGEEGIEP